MKYRNKQTKEIVKAFNHYQSNDTDWPKWGKERIRIINKVDPEFEWIVLNEDKEMIFYRVKEFIEKFEELKKINVMNIEPLDNYSFRTYIADEMTREQLINRLCEYRERIEDLETVHYNLTLRK